MKHCTLNVSCRFVWKSWINVWDRNKFHLLAFYKSHLPYHCTLSHCTWVSVRIWHGIFSPESAALWWHHGWIWVSQVPWGSRLVLTLHSVQNHLTDHFSSHLINISAAQSIFITEHAPSDRLCPCAFIYSSYLFISSHHHGIPTSCSYSPPLEEP